MFVLKVTVNYNEVDEPFVYTQEINLPYEDVAETGLIDLMVEGILFRNDWSQGDIEWEHKIIFPAKEVN